MDAINMKMEDPRPIYDAGFYDVIVVGGGIAGISAAVAASREGVKVLLIEKSILLGGLATAGLISWYEPLCDGAGKKMISGIAEELIRLSIRYGFHNLPECWKEVTDEPQKDGRFASYFSPNVFVLALDEYLKDNGVNVLLDTLGTFPVMDQNICKGIVTETKGGRLYIRASVVIDASGDGDILHRSGVPVENGKNFLSYFAHIASREAAQKVTDGSDFLPLRHWKMAGANMYGKGHPENVPYYAGLTAQEVTDFVLTGRRLLFDELKGLNPMDYELISIPSIPQLRTTRRLVGAYTFKGDELEVKFPDAIGSCGDFRSCGKHYQLPYGTLYHPEFPNLLAAGRIISAVGEGWEITRVIPVCALTGQAAGVAAALSVTGHFDVMQVPINLLQEHLINQKVIFV